MKCVMSLPKGDSPKGTYEDYKKFSKALSIAAPPIPVLNHTYRYSDEDFRDFITSGQGKVESYIIDKNFYLIKAPIFPSIGISS